MITYFKIIFAVFLIFSSSGSSYILSKIPQPRLFTRVPDALMLRGGASSVTNTLPPTSYIQFNLKESNNKEIHQHANGYFIDSPNLKTFNSTLRTFNNFKKSDALRQDSQASLATIFSLMLKNHKPVHTIYLILALTSLFIGQWCNIKVPFILQNAIDNLSSTSTTNTSLISNIKLSIFFYGLARAATIVFAELKTCFFVNYSQCILRKFALETFEKLHLLDSNFHLNNPSGVISVSYIRALRGFQQLLFQFVFSVLPTISEFLLVSLALYKRYGLTLASITMATFLLYIVFTVWITQFRINLRKKLVRWDNHRNAFLIDTLRNHESIKLFNSLPYELKTFNFLLKKIEHLNIFSTYTIGGLNIGQAILFGIGLSISLFASLKKLKDGVFSVGDLIAVNGLMLQLAVPFDLLGYTYQEIRQALVDMKYITDLLSIQGIDSNEPIFNPNYSLKAGSPLKVEFRNVTFVYPTAETHPPPSDNKNENQSIINMSNLSLNSLSLNSTISNVSFIIEPGQSVAIVGPSGSGKSTLLKLITKMIKPLNGTILLNDHDISLLPSSHVRDHITSIQQDSVLFDDTIEYNLLYGIKEKKYEEIDQNFVSDGIFILKIIIINIFFSKLSISYSN